MVWPFEGVAIAEILCKLQKTCMLVSACNRCKGIQSIGFNITLFYRDVWYISITYCTVGPRMGGPLLQSV